MVIVLIGEIGIRLAAKNRSLEKIFKDRGLKRLVEPKNRQWELLVSEPCRHRSTGVSLTRTLFVYVHRISVDLRRKLKA